MSEIAAPPAPEVYNPADTAARHANLFANSDGAKESLPDGTDLAALAVQEMHKEKVKAKETVKNDSGIPPELLGADPKKPEPEIDLLSEEPKGQLKNENYKKLQTHAKERLEKAEARAAALEKEYTDYKGKFKEDALPEKYSKELESLRTTLKEREDLIGKKYVEESREFKDRFSSKQSLLIEQLKEAGKELELEGADKLIGLSLKKRLQALSESELSPAAAGHITSLLQQYDQIEAEKSGYLKEWELHKSELNQREMAQADSEKAKMKDYLEKAFQKTLGEMSEKFGPLKKIAGNDAWNAQIDETIAEARKFLDGNFSDEQYSEIILAGLGAKRQNAMYEKVVGMYKEVKAENDSLKAAAPDVNGTTAKPTTNEGMDNDRFTRTDAHRAWRNITGAPRENEIA